MVSSDCFVTVIAPLFNDEDIVQEFIEEVSALLCREYENYELVLVDDGSIDDTVGRVSDLLTTHRCIRLIRLSRHFGREVAISAGLDSAIGDFVVVMMPDGDPVPLIPSMTERCRRGAGVVSGVLNKRGKEPFYMTMGTGFFYWCFNRLLKMDVPRNSTDFRVFSRQSVNAVTRIKDRSRYLRTFSSYVGYGHEIFPYDAVPRRSKRRTKRFLEAVNLAVDMTVANSVAPLRLAALLGTGLSLLSFIHIVYVLCVYLFSDHVVEGWATRSLHSSVMFAFVFLVLATLCEYVGRLLEESKDRPLYFVMEERNSSVIIADEQRKNVVTESSDD